MAFWRDFRTTLRRLKMRLRRDRPDDRVRSHIITVTSEGESFQFIIGNATGRDWYEREDHASWPEMRFIRDRLLRPDTLVVECGAHHGFTTTLLSRWVGPRGRVLAFEALPKNVEILRNNVELNKLANVEVHGKALGSRDGHVWMTEESNSSVASSRLPGCTEVEMVRLESVLAGQAPDLVKMDVESSEIEVLRGMGSSLDVRRTRFAIELHLTDLRSQGVAPEIVFKFLDPGTYEFWLGTGDEAKRGILPFDPARELLPQEPRVYLFASPR